MIFTERGTEILVKCYSGVLIRTRKLNGLYAYVAENREMPKDEVETLFAEGKNISSSVAACECMYGY